MNFKKINLFKKIFIIFVLITIFLGNKIYSGNFLNIPPEKKLMDGAIKNNIDLIKEALESGADINTKDKYGNSPLHFLVSDNNREATAIILNHPNCDIENKNISGNTPLHAATIKNAPYCLKLLLKHGANINAQNNFGQTPLHIAVILKNKNLIKILIFLGANTKLKDEEGETPIDISDNMKLKKIITKSIKDRNIFENKLKQIRKKIRTNALKKESIFQTNTKTSPIEQTSITEEINTETTAPAPQIISQTFKTKQDQPPQVSKKIATPFIAKPKPNKKEMNEKLKELNKKRQETNKITNKKIRSEIERENQSKLKEKKREKEAELKIKKEQLMRIQKLEIPTTILQALLKSKFVKKQHKLDIEKIENAKHNAIKVLQSQIKTNNIKAEFINKKQRLEILQSLCKSFIIKKQYDTIQFEDQEKIINQFNTILEIKNLDKINKIEEIFDFKDEYGNTALHFFVESKDLNSIEYLISNGFDIDQQNNNGETALLIAIKRSKPLIVNLLLNLGANPNIKAKYKNNLKINTGTYIDDNTNIFDYYNRNTRYSDQHLARRIKYLKLNTQETSPLHEVIKNQNEKIFNLLIKSPKINLNIQTKPDGYTPLHMAIEQQNLNFVKELITLGVDLKIKTTPIANKSPLSAKTLAFLIAPKIFEYLNTLEQFN